MTVEHRPTFVTKASLRRLIEFQEAEIDRQRLLLDGLSDNGGWFTNCVGLLGLGFLAGVAVTMVVVVGAAWVTL